MYIQRMLKELSHCVFSIKWIFCRLQILLVNLYTVRPRSLYPFHTVTYYIKWVENSWTHSNLPELVEGERSRGVGPIRHDHLGLRVLVRHSGHLDKDVVCGRCLRVLG